MQLPQFSIWVWILILAFLPLFSFALVFSIYYLSSWIKEKILKRRMPKDLNHPDFLNPGKPLTKDIKEVERNEIDQFRRSREYEKLRRIGEKYGFIKSDATGERRTENASFRISDERRIAPEKSFGWPDGINRNITKENGNTPRKNVKSTRFHKPEFS